VDSAEEVRLYTDTDGKLPSPSDADRGGALEVWEDSAKTDCPEASVEVDSEAAESVDCEVIAQDIGSDGSCDVCMAGQIQCLSQAVYRSCELDDAGCWNWGKIEVCDLATGCACMVLEDKTCMPGVDICSCIPDCEGKECVDYTNCPDVQFVGSCLNKCGPCDSCPEHYSPVCGNDGYRYWNICDLLVCNQWAGVQPQCKGECIEGAQCGGCSATCEPVCGSLGGYGKPFMNSCLMECEGAEEVDEAECCPGCPQYEEWICGSDFRAYRNACVMECWAPEAGPALYEIPKDPQGEYLIHGCEECHCKLGPDDHVPVCGSDYKTYYNLCMLACAHDEAPDVVEDEALCEAECGLASCPCPTSIGGKVIPSELLLAWPGDDGRRGVCGSDGFTYGNMCSAVYAGAQVKAESWCPSCQTACAGYPYEPVCCADGVTYPNPCIPAKCNHASHVGDCQVGACGTGG